MKIDNIVVEGHVGTWYVINHGMIQGKEYCVLESEVYGDEAPCLITDIKFNVVLEDVYNGFDDLYEHLGIY